MYYYLYEVINLLNGKIYVGAHKTRNLDDGYMGSGKVIQSAIKKYGKDNFQRNILEFCSSAEEMYRREKEIVTEDFLARDDTYNIRRGGSGGFDYINKNGLNYKGYDTVADRNKEISGFANREKLTEDAKERMAHGSRLGIKNGKERIREIYGVDTVFSLPEIQAKAKETSVKNMIEKYGVSHPSQIPGVGEKIRKTKQERRPQLGEKNSQYGTIWITNEIKNKKIPKTEKIPFGWRKGRITNY
jgi:hypothetical protein